MRAEDLAVYRRDGHVTLAGIFRPAEMDAAVVDVMAWADTVLEGLSEADRHWYVDRSVVSAEVLRKLDNPHFHRPFFRDLAADPRLVSAVEAVLGPGVGVYFSQIFFKPPHGGGPKPVHQDNYYFGPSNPDGVVTAWIALDDATTENGCLYFGDGTHLGPVYHHVAPADRRFDLHVPDAIAAEHPMTPAPVPKGGVSLHHGGTFHQSSDNRSERWRRACALHYVSNKTRFVTPALPYDDTMVIRVT